MKTLLLVPLLMLFSVKSVFAAEKAGLFVEPSVSFEISDFGVNYPFASSSGDTNGFGLGARLGFHVSDAVFVGVDGRFSRLKFNDENSVFNYDANANSFNVAPVVGMQMPGIGLRLWGSYIMASTLDPSSESVDLKFSDGKGFRIGAGFRVQAVSLNLEYQKIDYGTTSIEEAGPITDTNTSGVKLKNEAWIASVSFPISL